MFRFGAAIGRAIRFRRPFDRPIRRGGGPKSDAVDVGRFSIQKIGHLQKKKTNIRQRNRFEKNAALLFVCKPTTMTDGRWHRRFSKRNRSFFGRFFQTKRSIPKEGPTGVTMNKNKKI